MEEDIILQERKQNCGDILKVLEKTNIQNNKRYLYKGVFLNYPCEVLFQKIHFLNGNVNNPQIEQVEFIDKIWSQNCGYNIKILEKIIEGENKGKWKCKFIENDYIVISTKQHIINGKVKLDDTLLILNKEFKQKNNLIFIPIKYKSNNYEGYFKEYPKYIIKNIKKTDIINGNVKDFKLNHLQLLDKEFRQNCGDILKIIDLIPIIKNGKFYYKAEFQINKCIVEARLDNIKNGQILNPNIENTLYTKEYLIKILKENFKEKPTFDELSKFLNLSRTYINNLILKYNLGDFIKYNYNEQENYIYNFINNFNIFKIQKNIFNLIPNREIDLYILNLKIGFEYNGNYWHSELYKSQFYHQEKSLLAQKQSIKLFHIWEWELEYYKDKIEFYIKSKLNIFDKIIGARKCEIKEIKEYQKYAQFCNENHFQEECGAKIKLGLYYQNELIQIMSFGSPRFTNKYEWEIIRECSKAGYCILGGKEKLWKYFIKKYNPKNCISYCDFAKFTGESYLKLGFKFLRLNKPGFWWIDKNFHNVYPRTPQKHKEFKEKGYYRLWDCGQLVFEWYNNFK